MKQINIIMIILLVFTANCSFFNQYPEKFMHGLKDVRINTKLPYEGFYRWNWQIIELQSCNIGTFEHELTHHVMKRVGWDLERSQKHDFVFQANLEYIKSKKEK